MFFSIFNLRHKLIISLADYTWTSIYPSIEFLTEKLLCLMTITAVKIYPFDSGGPESSLRAYADITFNGVILIKGFRVLSSKSGGLFVGFPSQKGKDGQFRETVEFKSEELKSQLRFSILEAYKDYS